MSYPYLKDNNGTICLGFSEVSGYYTLLQKGFCSLGIPSVHLNTNDHAFNYQSEAPRHWLDVFICKLSRIRMRIRNPLLRHIFLPKFINSLLLCALALIAGLKYDAFIICTYNKRFWLLALVAFLRRRPVVIIMHGSDIRPPFISGIYSDLLERPKELVSITKKILAKARFIERVSTVIVSHPPCSQFLSKPFINWMYIGIPMTSDTPKERVNESDHVRIVHAPSRPLLKGSNVFKSVVDELKKQGQKIDYIELVNRANKEVHKELARGDLSLDELFSDSPMATFAAESAHFGNPALVCGYITDKDLFIDKDLIPPSAFCQPEGVKASLEKLVCDAAYRRTLGQNAQTYVHTYWSPEVVAKRFLVLLSGEAKACWYVKPQDITYVYGWGLNKERCKDLAATFYLNASKKVLKSIPNKALLAFCKKSAEEKKA